MAKLKPTFLRFKPSDSPDVVSNALYIRRAADGPVSAVDSGGNYLADRYILTNAPEPSGEMRVDLTSIPGMITEDTTYNIGIAAVDDAGNESSMQVLNNVPLDFAAPNPVSDLRLE